MKQPLPRVIEKKLGKRGAIGISNGGLIEIDPRQSPEDYLDTLIHETFHERFPKMTEIEVRGHAAFFSAILWRQGFRRIYL